MRKYLSILVFLVLTIALINAVSAIDSNNTETTDNIANSVQENSFSDNKIASNSNNAVNNYDEKSSTNTHEDEDEDCSSSIVQGENNDSACAFRRDGDYKVTINIEHDDSIVRHYKTDYSYFVHMMVSKNGWVIGNGGVDSSSNMRTIEKYSKAMINENCISSYYLNKIFSFKTQTSLGHYVIKAPNGTYSLIIRRDGKNLKDSGVLKPGQYLVVPNNRLLFQKGTLSNFKDTQDSMLSYTKSLASHDKYGVLRRQIITFYYKNNIVNSTVKVIASNDNGRYVGVNSGVYLDNIRTNTRFISSSKIPTIDNYINVDEINFIIRKAKTNVVSQNKYVNGSNVVLTATVKDEFGQNVNSGFVSVIVDGKTLKYNNGSVMYAYVKNGKVSLNTSIPNIWKKNNFTYYMRYYGNSRYADSLGKSAVVYVNNLLTLRTYHSSTIYYGGQLGIVNTLRYNQNNRYINGGKVFYKINGKTIRNSDNSTLFKEVVNGIVKFNYTFDSKYKAKTYVLTTIYVNGIVREEINTSITIKKIPTQISSPKVSVKNNKVFFTAKFVDKNNQPIKYDSYCSVKINGKTLKQEDTTRIFNITGGSIDFNFIIPYKLKKGNHTLSIVLPELKETLSLRKNYTITV